jgi:hypothetical protein
MDQKINPFIESFVRFRQTYEDKVKTGFFNSQTCGQITIEIIS